MKTVIFGAGVIGSYYATRLYQANIDVSILARGEKFQNIKERGVVVEDFFTGEQTVSKIRVIGKPDDEAYDLVMVIVQMVQIDSVLPVLLEFKNAKSFLFIGNNINNFDNICKQLGPAKVLAGFGAVGGKRDGHRIIYADSESKRSDKKAPLVLGKVNEFSDEEFKKIKQLFKTANIKVQSEDDIEGWLKTHAAMILGVASAAYKADYNMNRIVKDKEFVKLIVKALRESMDVLKSLKVSIVPKKNRNLRFFPNFILEFVFRKLLDSEYAEIAIAGHAKAARSEMRALADAFLVLCQKTDVEHGAFKKLTNYI